MDNDLHIRLAAPRSSVPLSDLFEALNDAQWGITDLCPAEADPNVANAKRTCCKSREETEEFSRFSRRCLLLGGIEVRGPLNVRRMIISSSHLSDAYRMNCDRDD